MVDINKKIVSYISITQPTLEKFASQHNSFISALKNRLDTLVKSGSITNKEAEKIYGEVNNDPSKVFGYLDVPTYTYKMGSVKDNGLSGKTSDPLLEFVMS